MDEAQVKDSFSGETKAASSEHADLKRKTTRGALVSTTSQLTILALRTGSMVLMARLLGPEDFGIVGMVTAFTGFLGLFRDAGLSTAAVQRDSITPAETSTLFWVNVGIGLLLASMTILAAPILTSFYNEPRLLWIAIVLSASFMFNGLGAQHRAILQRSMRFATMAAIEIAVLVLSVGIGAGVAVAGFGYWALVAMAIAQPAIGCAGVWLTTQWVPTRCQRSARIRSMLWFGSTVTLNGVISYVTYNADKVLVGRLLGADALGIYGRACQLISLPTENLNSSLSMVIFPALSRVQNDPDRLRSYFLKGYGLFLVLVLPITMGCALFADDIVDVLLGAKWHEAAGIFRLMAPTIVAFALINPFGWLLMATGRAARSLKISVAAAPIVIMSYAIGLRHGTHGVAAGFSIAMVALIMPVVCWAKLDTLIRVRDILGIAAKPLLSVFAGAVGVWAVSHATERLEPVFVRLVFECSVLFGIYIVILLFVFSQAAVYVDLLRTSGLWPRGVKCSRQSQSN